MFPRLRHALLTFAVLGVSSAQAQQPADPAALEFFEKKVRPVLAEYCYSCHAADAKKLKADLRLDSRAGMLKGGDNGPVLVPGQPEKSKLIEAIGYKNVDLRMPPKSKLPDAVVADLTRWVKEGAPWPNATDVKVAGKKDEFDLAKRKQEHWSWQPVRPQEPPPVKDAAWPRSPLDRFILAKLEAKNLKPAADADPATVLRRLYFDLIGLPPTVEQQEKFRQSAIRNPQSAITEVVDELLAAPQFGERWGRHWLDLMRYAESRGHEFDYTIPNAHQYRDYVIRALNADVPYNQFVKEHLAGDLLPSPRLHPTEKFNESILGTGFLFLGEQIHSPVDICQDKADRLDNMIDVLSKSFLGLTVACARCHDHKFDAISTKDYYSLFGFLESSSYRLARFDSIEHNRQVAAELWRWRAQERPGLQKAFVEACKPALQELPPYVQAAGELLQLAKVKAVQEHAEKHKLDAALLQRWVAYLPKAVKDARDPLHLLARAALEKDASKIPALLSAAAVDFEQRSQAAKKPPGQVEVIADYTQPRTALRQDGELFGPGPAQAGELHVAGTAAKPSLQIIAQTAAVRDAAWDRPSQAPGSENEGGVLGKILGSGRTLRTPAFTIKSGRVHYLVRGKGSIYAGVDGHIMLAGPLHGNIVMGVSADKGWQWLSHDLTRYKGSRASVAFTPADGADFAVAMVVQAETAPPLVERPNWLIHKLVKASTQHTLASLAVAYREILQAALLELAADRIAQLEDPASDAQLLAWLAQNRELLPPAAAWEKTLSSYADTQTAIVAKAKSASRLAPALLEGNGVDEAVYIRGSYKTLGEKAPRRFLEALSGAEPLSGTGSGRLQLAETMTDPAKNPYIARVFVNRVWHHLFGRGIVGSVDNFGVLGEAPSHPELLDALADDFVKQGWSLKKLIRTLVLTRTYQLSTQPDAAAKEVDPTNQLLQHMRLKRLEGEAIRDAILSVSGRLDLKMYGPSVPVYLNEFQQGRGRPGSGPLDGNGRRSVYLGIRRNFLAPFLLAFDTPSPFSSVGKRTVSNVPAQALILLNDPFVQQQAEVWAKRLLTEKAETPTRIDGMYRAALGRTPTAQELQACAQFLERHSGPELSAWTSLAHVLFNTKEFIYLQ